MPIKDVGDYIIVVEHINKTFANGVKAVVDFTAKIQRGEVVVVIGPSGQASQPSCAASMGWKRSTADPSSSTAHIWTTTRKTGWKFAKRSVWSFSSSTFFPT